MRKKIIAGNWKMNKTGAEAASFARDLKLKTFHIHNTVIIICPPYTALSPVYDILKGSKVKIGAQNVHWEISGAYTGEISAPMIRDAGCEYVIIGHSERRQYFGESNQSVNKKIKTILTTELTPIVCIGETLEQREQGHTQDVVKNQIIEGFDGLTAEQVQRMIIAYEPIWAIGTGVTATPEQAEEVHRFIREQLRRRYDPQTADRVPILYGGSVKPGNISDLLAQSDIDGGLIGGASLQVASFVEMIDIAEKLSN